MRFVTGLITLAFLSKTASPLREKAEQAFHLPPMVHFWILGLVLVLLFGLGTIVQARAAHVSATNQEELYLAERSHKGNRQNTEMDRPTQARRSSPMEDRSALAQRIYEEFIREAEAQGLSITHTDNNTGQLYIPAADGSTLLVSLNNLIQYYDESRDENAVRDFVAKIAAHAKPQDEPEWAEAKYNVYISVYPSNSEYQSPFAREVTSAFDRFVILDTPSETVWVLPELLEKWGIDEIELERQALENGNRLLEKTEIIIGDVSGHPLGSFRVHDLTLTAALLFAPDLKEKVMDQFGWPLYAILPDKVTCFFFGKEDYAFFQKRLGSLVTEKYESTRRVSPELLEFSDEGVRVMGSWSKQRDSIIWFDD